MGEHRKNAVSIDSIGAILYFDGSAFVIFWEGLRGFAVPVQGSFETRCTVNGADGEMECSVDN